MDEIDFVCCSNNPEFVREERRNERRKAVAAILSIPYTEIDGVPLVIREEAIQAIIREGSIE